MKTHRHILVLTLPDSAGKGRRYRTFAAVSMGWQALKTIPQHKLRASTCAKFQWHASV